MAAKRISPIITLTTDFGLADHYVGTMKGVLLSRCPSARLVDISHEVPPFSIYSGAYTIAQAAPYFPPGTVHLVVVDPGVGTERKALLVEAAGQFFIAPDNGVLSMIVASEDSPKAHEIMNRDLWVDSPSSTFHGRDVFAPVAAAIANRSAKPSDVGPRLKQIELLPDLESEQKDRGVWTGRVLSIDRFGNVITNFKASEFGTIATGGFAIRARNHEITVFQRTFGDAPPHLCFAYFGSSGYLELGIKQESAAQFLQVSPGQSIMLRI
ncbi:MAG: SAM-dependent chlorinase/fluorinase [Bryobacteraceae bacterium]